MKILVNKTSGEDFKMQNFKLDTVNRMTLSQQVLEQIILLIESGELNPGDKLPSEMVLIEQFEVSRPVLREAFSSLESLGIIKRKPRGGTYINNKIGSGPFEAIIAVSLNNIPAVIEARMTLELGLITLAAEKITEEELDELEKTIRGIEEASDTDYGALDKKFHRIIAYSANNPIIEGMIDPLLYAHETTDNLIKIREPIKTVDHHTAIYEALKNRDPLEAFHQLYKHLMYVKGKILEDHNED